MKQGYNYILIIIFLLILILPQAIKMANIFQESSTDENRNMAEIPEVDLKHLDSFPEEFDAYYNDNFGLRPIGLKLYNNFNYFFLKKSPAPQKAILGKDGWLYQGRDIDLYQGIKRLSESELKQLEDEFNKRWNFLNEHNCRLIFIAVPTKKMIYPEYLPNEYFRYSNKTMTDQFIEMLRTKTNVEVIDLRPVILAAKKEHPVLYHKMDNHWNDIGAYYASKAIVDYINQTESIGNPHAFDEYSLDTTTYYGGSIAKMLGVQDSLIDYRLHLNPNFKTTVNRLPQKYQSPERFPYPGSYERRFTTENDSLPRMMMINDSFGEYYYKFLPEHFSYSIFLFDGWEFKLHSQKVLEEKPDIFMISTFEGFIPNILDNIYRDENKLPEPNDLVTSE